MKMSSVFIVLLFSCIVFIGNGSSASTTLGKEEYIIRYGEKLTHVIKIDDADTLINCTVTDPSRVLHNLYPGNTDDPSINFSHEHSPSSPCGFTVSPIEKKHEREWILKAIYSKNGDESIISQTVNVILRGDDMINDKVVLTTPRGEGIEFELDRFDFGNMIFCNVKLPSGTVYEIYPKSNISDQHISIPSHQRCAFTIDVLTNEYTGSWEMNTDVKLFNSNQTYVIQQLDILIEEKIDAKPSNDLEIFPNYDLSISLSENVKNLKECEIIPPQTAEKKTIYSSESPDCLYVIKNITPEMNGTWIIRGIGDVILNASIDVFVKEQPIIDTDISIILGIPNNILLGPENSVYCEAHDAHNVVRARQSGQCKVNIPNAAFVDGGVWTVKVGLPGSISLITYEYNIHVEDLGEQNPGRILSTTKISADGNYAQIVCKVLINSMDSCRMIRADGEVFIFHGGMGQGRYKHFVNDISKHENGIDFVQCGVHIENPTPLDFDPWKCVVTQDNTEYGLNLMLKNHSILDPGQIAELANINLTTSDVNVTLNESFDIVCNYPLSINYCWFRAPNGSVLSVVEGTSNPNYEYIGSSLNEGYCGIKIKSSSRSDRGLWRCNVGTSAVVDKRADIRVLVYDSLLVAERQQAIWHKGISLTCKTHDNSSVEYCRFMRPDGRGINPIALNTTEYITNGTNLSAGRCQLDITHYSLSDIGVWYCYAKRLNGDVEHSDHLIIYSQNWGYYPLSSHVLAWTLYILTMMIVVVVITAAVYKYHSNLPLRSQNRGLSHQSTMRTSTNIPPVIRRRSIPPAYTPTLFQIDETKTSLD